MNKFASLSRTKNIHLVIIVLAFILYLYLPFFPFLGPRNELSPVGGVVIIGVGIAWILYSLAVFVWVSARTIEVLVKSRRNNPNLLQVVFTIVFFVGTQLIAAVIISTVAMGGGLSGLPLALALILAQSLSLVYVPELAKSL
jgi:membrane protease YdiL (CAAX protease family)